MKILVLGSTGQLGSHLREVLENAKFWDRSDADFADPKSLQKLVTTANPDVIINASAYTAVDNAEREPDLARLINAEAPAALAKACDALLIHFSTDYVFAGTKGSGYEPNDHTNPNSVYGQTKLAGEIGVAANCDRYWIFRISWVFSEFGNNFVKTMLRLAQDRDELNVVDDQIGIPTYAGSIAKVCAELIKGVGLIKLPSGIYHVSGGAVVSWCQFSRAVFQQALRLQLITKPVVVNPITTDEYPTPAPRPGQVTRLLTQVLNSLSIFRSK